jgi:hypothetical protein
MPAQALIDVRMCKLHGPGVRSASIGHAARQLRNGRGSARLGG